MTLNLLSKPYAFVLLALVLLLASCGKSNYSTFSKPGDSYKSAQEIAELKKKERQERRLAKKTGKPIKEIHLGSNNKKPTRSIH
ncbi:MAG: hypothetical protein ACO1OQ_01700, partial [Rufibacter sp.]